MEPPVPNPSDKQSVNETKVELRFLVYRRGQIKATLTRFNTFLGKISDQDLGLPENITQIKTRIETLEQSLCEFDRVQSRIEHICIQYDFPENADQDDERAEFEEHFFNSISRGKLSLKKGTDSLNLVSQPQLLTINDNKLSQNQNLYNNHFPVKLPPISLPQFSGSYDQWTQFYETFESLVDSNPSLTNVQKFYYLKSILKDDAFQTISSLTATDDNYIIAWDLLKERYQNKKAIIHTHVKSIFTLSPIKDDTHTNLRKFLDTFQKHFRSLEKLGEDVAHWDTLLIFLLTSKLNSVTREQWEIFSKNIDSPSVADFISFSTDRYRLLESMDLKTYTAKSVLNPKAFSHFSTVSNQCPMCDEKHFVYACKKFKNLPINARYNEAKRMALCTNCLRPGHSASECKSTHSCIICQKRHHSLLHNNSKPPFQANKGRQFPNNSSNQQPTSSHSSMHEQSNSTHMQPCVSAHMLSDPRQGINENNSNNNNNYALNNNMTPSPICQGYSNPNSLLIHPETQLSIKLPSGIDNQNTQQSSSHTFSSSATTAAQVDNIQPCNQGINPSYNLSCANVNKPNQYVLLATAMVYVYDRNQLPILCKALLDGGSQSNFISLKLFNKLGLNSEKINIPICGINQKTSFITKRVTLNATSLQKKYNFKMSSLVIEKITEPLPQGRIDIASINIPADIQLADPNFNEPSDIDLLLGAGLFYDILCSGQIRQGKNNPIFQQTKLGWIISGPIQFFNPTHDRGHDHINCCFNKLITNNDLYQKLETFWKIEELPENPKIKLSLEELECESNFHETHVRLPSGRFQVDLPLKGNFNKLGNSSELAKRRFLAIERKFDKNSEFKAVYSDFIHEYINLGHMSRVDPHKVPIYPVFYLPHHAVEKADSLTTKLRVVFDASAKSSSGLSLNDVLKVGPTIQNDLFSILLRFRRHNFALTGDIAKMYRQVLVNPSQRCLQRIVWRDNREDELSHFELNTITYGTSSAAFLSTRCLKQISTECTLQFPIESQIICNDCYVDDIITGANSIDELIAIRHNLSSILKDYGFELRKFASNNPNVLSGLSNDNSTEYVINDPQSTKILGISWNSESDNFIYSSKKISTEQPITKRFILSTISQIFDPLGLLGPIVIQAKILLQKLWLLKLAWDEPIPNDLCRVWIHFIQQLSDVVSLKISRQVTSKNPKKIQIHGFCDSSINAYGACIYVRCEDLYNGITVNLLSAKSRVAPLKVVSLPRLELCGALLLTKLISNICPILDLPIDEIFYWTDSTIVLSWLCLEPRNLKTFVSNRTSEIQSLSDINNWYHIKSSQNPADMISRGINPPELNTNKLWWHGPEFLARSSEHWPLKSHISNWARQCNPSEIPEVNPKSVVLFLAEHNSDDFDQIFYKFSSYIKLLHVIAYCLRFSKNSRFSANQRAVGPLCQTEISSSLKCIIQLVQGKAFSEDIYNLKSHNFIKKTSKLSSLNPFIDDFGILRVGGRLKNAQLSFEQKHPILLPPNHPLTKLIITYEHHRNLHSGAHATLSFVRQQFWPLNGKSLVKKVIRSCIPCFKANPKSVIAQMGNLPSSRVTPFYPFGNTGVDYAGPFLLKDSKFRNKRILKCYICVFVCLSTKAIHLELATELSTASFISALKRFTARRGLCQNLYSDNGSNFIGAKNEFANIHSVLKDNKFQDFLIHNTIQFHFIPARSPHFGGIWESAVRSTKQHLKRILNDVPLTFEEFYTLLVQVESILNSRPLTPLTDDPNDLEVLTPGHFLIGRPINAVPELDVSQVPMNRLSRYAHVQKMVQNFWTRWSTDYLHTLHQRNKWKFQGHQDNLLGSLVLLKEDGLPSLQWHRGRIVDLHPGSDGVVRVVSVLTNHGITKRAVVKICLLPKDT